MNRAARRRLAERLPKGERKDFAAALRQLRPRPVPTPAELARANLERMGMQIVEARELLAVER